MAMSKAALRQWPWNNQPSKRHVWQELRTGIARGHIAKCLRCGSVFIETADTRAAVYCYASSQWLATHLDDDGKEG